MTTSRIVIAVIFQVNWFLLLGLADSAYSGYAVFIALLSSIGILSHHRNRHFILPILLVAFIGYGFDHSMEALGILTFFDSPAVATFWLLALWLVFFSSFQFLFFWITSMSFPLTGIIGGLGGLSSYYAASKLGAVSIESMAPFILLYGAFWAGIFLLGYKILIARELTEVTKPEVC